MRSPHTPFSCQGRLNGGSPHTDPPSRTVPQVSQGPGGAAAPHPPASGSPWLAIPHSHKQWVAPPCPAVCPVCEDGTSPTLRVLLHHEAHLAGIRGQLHEAHTQFRILGTQDSTLGRAEVPTCSHRLDPQGQPGAGAQRPAAQAGPALPLRFPSTPSCSGPVKEAYRPPHGGLGDVA